MYLFTKRKDVLRPNPVKPRSREIRGYNDRIALKFWQASKISERLEKSKPESLAFETSRDFVVSRPSAKWIEALLSDITVKGMGK